MKRHIGVVDYGVGNLFSVMRGIRAADCSADIVADPDKVQAADAILLPGVGAFGAGIEKLRSTGMGEAVVAFARSGRPLLGICLGMQLLMSRSFEFGEHQGLGLIDGDVVPLPEKAGCLVPNTGWCEVTIRHGTENTPFARAASGTDFYFVHSFHCVTKDKSTVLGSIDYGGSDLAAMVGRDNVYGCQFHPEISAEAGIDIYRILGHAD